jgi:hypothetical protein
MYANLCLGDVLDVILNRRAQAKIRKSLPQLNDQDEQDNPWNAIGYASQRANLDTWGKSIDTGIVPMIRVVLMHLYGGSSIRHRVLIDNHTHTHAHAKEMNEARRAKRTITQSMMIISDYMGSSTPMSFCIYLHFSTMEG